MFNKAQQKAVKIADQVCFEIMKKIRAGVTEKEVARWIKKSIKRHGGKRPAFKIIVASGKRSAKLHGFASQKKIKKNEIIMLDLGAVVSGQHSDLTRTFFLGKANKKFKKIYRVVLEAQKRAIKMVRPGVSCSKVDQAARNYISKKGFGKYFVHSTGHGVGKKIHQAPKISAKNKNKLKAGMVITVEPGIYLKGWGGVRVEDMLLVTKSGSRVLTRCPKKVSI